MKHKTLGMVWIGGLILALVLYATGPDQFLIAATQFSTIVLAWLDLALRSLSIAGFDMIRSLGIAVFCVFLLLAIIALQRGLRARGAIILVSALFLLLAKWGQTGSTVAWTAALILGTLGAMTMTQRLIRAPQKIG